MQLQLSLPAPHARAWHPPFCGLALLAFSLSACAQTPPSSSAVSNAPQVCGQVGPLVAPPGVSIGRMQLLDVGRHYNVYTAVETMDERTLKLGAVNAENINRIFIDQIQRTKRFKVFDSRATVVLDKSDIQVTARVVDADQLLKPFMEGGRRFSQSRVTLSVQVKNMLTGEQMLTSDVKVTAETGHVTGDRVMLTSADDPNSSEMRARLVVDFKNALNRAFDLATERLEQLLPPMARVISANGCNVDVFGGKRGGLQSEDELVVFRTQKRQLGESIVLANTQPVALLLCMGVGDDVSQCTIKQSVSGFAPADGDYAVITPESLRRTREQ
jgi:hypothetical protein